LIETDYFLKYKIKIFQIILILSLNLLLFYNNKKIIVV